MLLSRIGTSEIINSIKNSGGGLKNASAVAGTAYAMAIDPSTHNIYLGGICATWNGTSIGDIVRIRPDGSIDTGFATSTAFGTSLQVAAIALDSNNDVYVGGSFTTYTGSTNNRIIKLFSSGRKDSSFNNSTGFNSGRVTCIAIDSNGKIYCGGTFTSYKGTTANRIIRLNTDGTKDTGFDNSTGFDAEVRTMAIDSNGKIYCAGDFTTYKSTTYQRIIRLNTDGSIDTGFNSTAGFNTAGNYILKIKIDSNGKIYAVGGFTTYKSVTANRIIRLNTDGTKDTGFDNSTGFDAETDDVVFDHLGQVYVTGQFTSYKGSTYRRIIKLNTDGTIDTSFDATSTNYGFSANQGIVMLFDSFNRRINVGGNFSTYRSTTQNGFTRINLTGVLDTV